MKSIIRHSWMLCASLLLSIQAQATPVTPVSYTYDQPNSCGSWCNYFDPNFTKLTDGTLGFAGWAADQGQTWVGWNYKPVVNIDFDFGNAVHISKIDVGSTQDNLGDVVLPTVNIFASSNGSSWSLFGNLTTPANPGNNVDPYSLASHGFLTLDNLGINNRYVRVQLVANGPWSFTDEVRFSAVPLPATAWLFGSALLGLIGLQRRS